MPGRRKSLPNKPRREVKFSSDGGKFSVHPSLMCGPSCGSSLMYRRPSDGSQRDPLQHQDDADEYEVDLTSSLHPPEQLSGHLEEDPGEDDPSCYVWRSQDYSFLPVKPPQQVNQTLLSYLRSNPISLISS